MRWVNAFGVACMFYYAILGFALTENWWWVGSLIVLATAIWAGLDAHWLGLKKYKGGVQHPLLVFWLVLLLWVIFFPAYLVRRERMIDGELRRKKEHLEA
jgi:hypothetical protein